MPRHKDVRKPRCGGAAAFVLPFRVVIYTSAHERNLRMGQIPQMAKARLLAQMRTSGRAFYVRLSASLDLVQSTNSRVQGAQHACLRINAILS